MMKAIYKNLHLKNFIQSYSGLEWISNSSFTTGSTRGYSDITTSWFESGKSQLNNPGLSAAQPWEQKNDNNSRNQLVVQGCKGTIRREKPIIKKDDLLNPPHRRTL